MIGTVLARGMPLVILDEGSKSPLHVGLEEITSEDISEEISSNSFSVAVQVSGARGEGGVVTHPVQKNLFMSSYAMNFLPKHSVGHTWRGGMR